MDYSIDELRDMLDKRDCHEEVTQRRGGVEPCNRVAVAYRIDPTEHTPYPVCVSHCRGEMVPLEVEAPADEREALAKALNLAYDRVTGMGATDEQHLPAADAILAAGYRKPEAAPSDPDSDVRAWIDKTLALPMYQNAISEYGQGVVETLRSVRKVLDGGMHPDTRAALRTSQPVQVEPPSVENLEIVNGWLVERGVNPRDYPAGAAYGAQPYSDAEPLVHLSKIPGWPVQVEVTDEMVDRVGRVMYASWSEWSDEDIHAEGIYDLVRSALEAALGGGE